MIRGRLPVHRRTCTENTREQVRTIVAGIGDLVIEWRSKQCIAHVEPGEGIFLAQIEADDRRRADGRTGGPGVETETDTARHRAVHERRVHRIDLAVDVTDDRGRARLRTRRDRPEHDRRTDDADGIVHLPVAIIVDPIADFHTVIRLGAEAVFAAVQRIAVEVVIPRSASVGGDCARTHDAGCHGLVERARISARAAVVYIRLRVEAFVHDPVAVVVEGITFLDRRVHQARTVFRPVR